MSERWFIPASLAAFAVFVGGLWAYLSYTQPGNRERPGDSSLALFDGEAQRVTTDARSKSNALSGSAARRSATALPAKHRRRHQAAGPSLAQIGAQVAERMDEASVKLRGRVGESTFGQLAGGQADVKAGRLLAAVARFDRALAKDPTNVAALAGKAAAMIELSRFEEAVAVYDELVLQSPADATVRYNYGVLLYRLARFREAAEQLREAVSIDPDHASAQYNLASLAQRDGRIGEARRGWEAFTRLRPSVASGWFNLGVVLMDFDIPLEAAGAFEVATMIDPEDPYAHLNLGIAYASAGLTELALGEMHRANELLPCDDAILGQLARLGQGPTEPDDFGADDDRPIASVTAAEVEDSSEPP